jgi:hypothetical protein
MLWPLRTASYNNSSAFSIQNPIIPGNGLGPEQQGPTRRNPGDHESLDSISNNLEEKQQHPQSISSLQHYRHFSLEYILFNNIGYVSWTR